MKLFSMYLEGKTKEVFGLDVCVYISKKEGLIIYTRK